jgi:hypothetical protein
MLEALKGGCEQVAHYAPTTANWSTREVREIAEAAGECDIDQIRARCKQGEHDGGPVRAVVGSCEQTRPFCPVHSFVKCL